MPTTPTQPTSLGLPRRTLIVCVIDKSGSMSDKVADVLGGFAQFLTEQQAQPGDAHLIVTLFDTNVTQFADAPIAQVKPLDAATYKAGGNTALLDVVGEAIEATDKHVTTGDKVIMLVMTDGQENSSTHTSLEALRSRIEERRTSGWDFVFLGADENAWSQAGAMGFSPTSTGTYVASGIGTRASYVRASANVTTMRAKGVSADSLTWTTDENGQTTPPASKKGKP